MPLVNMRDMLHHAYHNGYAIGAFDLISSPFLHGILQAAERGRAPVILSLAESHFGDYDFTTLMAEVERAAQRATIPVAIHLDHGASLDSAIVAVNHGCNGVMIDYAHLPLEENIRETRAAVAMACGCGVTVEGEIGYVPGVEGEDAERHPGDVRYTGVDEAQRYVAETGVDLLAVSIGTVHGKMCGEPALDIERLAAINKALQLPLVIHGGTGLSDEQFGQLVRNGVAKINYFTALSEAAAAVLHENVAAGVGGGYAALMRGVDTAIAQECERMIRLWGGAGQADAVMAMATPWAPVEHLIVYNVDGLDATAAAAMAARGRAVLAAIPGVRHVVTGEAMQEDAAYRYTWLVRFCHPAVIDSYRNHPDHVAFADNEFRPVAGGRVSIDFSVTAEIRASFAEQ